MPHGPGHLEPPTGAHAQRALAALHGALDAVVFLDDNGLVVEFNPAAERLLGWDAATVGREIGALLESESLRTNVGLLLAGSSAGPRSEHDILGAGGRRIEVEATLTRHEPEAGCAATLRLRDMTGAKRTERLRDLEHLVARRLAAARSGRAVADDLLALVAQDLGFDHAELWVTDDEHRAQRLAAEWRQRSDGPFAEAARRLVIVRGSDLAGMAWEIGETVCIDDARTLEGLPRSEAILAEGIRGCAALPMRVGREVAAVAVLARVGGEPLDAELRQTLHSLAAQLGQFTERRAAERRLQEETVAVAAVASGTRELAQSVDAGAAAKALVDAALGICAASYAFLAVPDPESDALVMRATAPAPEDLPVTSMRFEPDEPSVVMRVYRSREAVFLPDVLADPDADAERAEQAGVRSALLQPITRDDEVLGVLGLAWDTRIPTLENSIRLLVRLLADEAAMALSRAELFRRLETAAHTDPLTGLANVRAWEEQLTRELAAARRDGRPVAVAVLDLDGFKILNDDRGHQHGDRVLRTAAAGWLSQLREGDMLARLGGDEFAALLPGVRPDDALALAERLRTAIEDVTVSIGVAYWDGEEAPSQLRGRADTALYAAKAAGRDRVWSG